MQVVDAQARSRTSHAGLSDAWRQWVLIRLARGESAVSVSRQLVEAGAEPDVASRELELLHNVALPLYVESQRLQLALRLRRDTAPRELEVRSLKELDDFYPRYYDLGTPLVIPDGARALVDTGMWEPAWLIQRFGDVMVRVDQERDMRPDHYVNPERRSQRLRFGDLLSRFSSDVASNDVYMVSRNRTLDDELSDLRILIQGMPPFLEDSVGTSEASLWVGPVGTVTPLHHDTCSVFFAQLFGNKRVRLVSPLATELLLGPIHDTFYSRFDVDNPGDVPVIDVTLEPGMGLFIPAGYWHHVTALSASISLSFTNFRCTNEHDYYRPGELGGLPRP